MKESVAPSLLRPNFTARQTTWAIRLLFTISVFLIILLSVSYHTINRELVFYSERVDHTHKVIDRIEKIRIAVYETTYSGRGFLLLGGDSDREAMLSKALLLPSLADSLSEVIYDYPAQAKRVGPLRDLLTLYGDRISRFADTNPLALSPQQKGSLMSSGRELTARINAQLDHMELKENTLKAERTVNRDNYKQQIFRFNWAIMGVALAFLLASFLLLERELKTNRLYKIELENKVENLNRSNSELEQFAYVASHDLQEPLRKIRSFTDFIKAKNTETIGPETNDMLVKIDRSATRMQMLINDLLSFSRSLQTTMEPAPVDLNALFREIQVDAMERLKPHVGRFNVQALPTVPGYESQLNQLLQNIVSNAIKYRKPNETLILDVLCEEVSGVSIPGIRMGQEEEAFYKLTFQDNGIGFAQEFSEKIFVIFQRLHSIGTYEGSGIGLAICRKVAFNHRGYILAEGKEKAGAKFYLYLPKKLS